MEPEFITYQKFNDPALAKELAETLEDNGIEYFIAEETSGFDPSLVMSNAPVDYVVKIKNEDFEQVNDLLREKEEENIEGIDKDYYLFSFTNDELMEVLTKADEWSAFDMVLARKILGERGMSINEEQFADINKKRVEELKTPDKPQVFWITIGYILAFAGGALGIFIGWYLATGKKTLPDGERIYEYTENDRRHGRNIFYISIIVFLIAIIIKFWVAFND